ncbi:hydantoinase/carbamoylase family amidase [Pandoraea nosoerga]|uniref:Amidase n=1 Tax=Pandoraea nosoerga TaxID=2508296 RepID=A0A5E4TLD7_9BURK|nr:hydantoinase/carbamoylase family amidase [Pandoraea nosoerga]MBN4665489.1 hydantoinase/carbamoylase family amidase [Pandoraea nosoerga]MBN4675014.1 hydantoinase/carbamoylase family amidase [Pandoraea nosoerga]MBN4680330.1 hydantoinase/carbamoylase family amidase [Pandoraea nosoerga]MBN4744437.1 hydantoinase/carbamoylase family amidase [Pandoraea nosoerga]VVD87374.1 amidase [Pandoraea nosoerga]
MELTALAPLAEQLFSDLRRLGSDGVGITRDSYGEGENAAASYLTDWAGHQGLTVTRDRAANLVFTLPDDTGDAPATWIGSHLDSVPQGGNYDGLAGIVAGLLCLVEQQRSGRRCGTPARVLALRGEESAWFGKAYMGSSALFGKLNDADLAMPHRTHGRTLAQCMAQAGADVEAIRSGAVLFDAARAKAWLELHIEQGPVMIARGMPVAIVPGIRGNVRHNRVSCVGEAGHSGAVPRWLRHDAMFAVADLITRLDEHWRALLERGVDLVVTTGIVGTDPAEHAISRIPGKVDFSLEVRSQSPDTLDVFYELMRTECRAIERDRGVRFVFDRRLSSAPATMDAHVSSLLAEACRALDLPQERVPSGAGHDAAIFANAGIPSGMVFVRNANGSHNPLEHMEMEDFLRGVQVLAAVTHRL